jgi:hypothetical protein
MLVLVVNERITKINKYILIENKEEEEEEKNTYFTTINKIHNKIKFIWCLK